MQRKYWMNELIDGKKCPGSQQQPLTIFKRATSPTSIYHTYPMIKKTIDSLDGLQSWRDTCLLDSIWGMKFESWDSRPCHFGGFDAIIICCGAYSQLPVSLVLLFRLPSLWNSKPSPGFQNMNCNGRQLNKNGTIRLLQWLQLLERKERLKLQTWTLVLRIAFD